MTTIARASRRRTPPPPHVRGLLLLLCLVAVAGLLPAAARSAEPAQAQTFRLHLPLLAGSAPAAGRPSSPALIARAVAEGRLSLDEGALYSLYAAFADPRLPAAYRGDDSDGDMSGAVSWALRRYPQLQAATKAQIEPFLLPPTEPGSWHELREAAAPPAAARAAGVAWRVFTQPGSPFKIWYQPRYGLGELALAGSVASSMRDEIWPDLVGLMGEPMSDILERANGGDSAFDIYIVSSPSKVMRLGHRCERQPAYLLLDREKAFAPGALASLVMYAIILGYERAEECAEYEWLADASAVWATDYVYPTSQLEQRKARGLLDLPAFSLWHDGDDALVPLGDTHLSTYGRYLWPFYLSRVMGQPGLIRAIWDNVAAKDSLAAIDSAVPGGFAQHWPRFARENWNRDPAAAYRTLDGLTAGARPYAGTQSLNLDGAPYREFTLNSQVSYLAAEYHHFTVDDPNASTLRFRNGFDDGAWPTARVTGWVRLEGSQTWEQPEDWTNLPERVFCRDLRAERVAELVVIISNSEWEDRGHRLRPARPPLVSTNNVGCAGWTGTVRYDYIAEDAGGDWIERRTTDVTFRRAEFPTDWPDALKIGRYFLPDPATMQATFEGWYWDEFDPLRKCPYSASVTVPIRANDSYLVVPTDDSRGYGGRGWSRPVETVPAAGACGATTLTVSMRDWWKAAVTVQEARALKLNANGRTISGSYTDGAGGVYSWEFTALPRE